MTAEAEKARRNAVLDGLSEDQLAALLPDLDEVALPLGQVLHEPGRTVDAVYFPLTGVVSIVAELDGYQVVETATVGREGMAGLSVLLGAAAPTERALVQVPGAALRMSTARFQHAVAVLDGPLALRLLRYTQAVFTQVARNAACNRVHPIRQRAARWLLSTQDQMGSPSFELTQEFLGQMLAVRRQSAGDAARGLAEEGCIRYTRGAVTILNRERLHTHACDCYDAIAQALVAARSAD
ncbi:MAG: Crp/Fnr family transcriptional regulator [Actinomycetota bacterium]|nr:Crp/Fnr family transcriptional regulator [Actinomycetota bacterium]